MNAQLPKKCWIITEYKEYWNAIVNAPDSKKFCAMNEELEVLILYKSYGNNCSIAAELPEGTNNNVKNRFYSIFRETVSKAK